MLVTADAAAIDGRRCVIDTAEPERGAVGDSDMAAGSCDHAWPVRAYLVELVARGISHLICEKVVIPSAAEHPFFIRSALCIVAHGSEHIAQRTGMILQLHLFKHAAQLKQMHVGIVEPRTDETTAEIDVRRIRVCKERDKCW